MSGAFSGGGGSTAYSRHGSASQDSQTILDGAFQSLLRADTPAQNRDTTGFDYEKSQMVSPTSYETNTQDLYENRMLRGLAMAKSGQAAVSAPIARGQAQNQSEVMEQFARERGKEVRDQQVIDRQLGTTAAKDFNAEKNSQQSVSTNSLVALASMLYPKSAANAEAFDGQGFQASNAYTVGSPCCFIFMEAFHGEMPAHVRAVRDELAPENESRRRGYIRCSKWLVPAMRVSNLARTLVWWGMIKPMTLAGGWRQGVVGYKNYWYLAPVAHAWFLFWSVLGAKK